MLLQHIIDIIESVAPRSWQEEWDNSGLQVGNPTADIKAALLTTDVTESVVSEAVSKGCNLIVSHHPLLFRGLKQVCGQNAAARCVEMAIRHDIAIYSGHTNMDSALRGVSGRMAEVLGVQDYRILVGEEHGLGVIGTLAEAMDPQTFLTLVRNRFGAPYVRYTAWQKPIRTVAMCGGSGAEFVGEAIAQGADAYLTADCKYHEFQDAEGQLMLVDIDHWVSEHYTRDIYKEWLGPFVPCFISETDRTPVHVLAPQQ